MTSITKIKIIYEGNENSLTRYALLSNISDTQKFMPTCCILEVPPPHIYGSWFLCWPELYSKSQRFPRKVASLDSAYNSPNELVVTILNTIMQHEKFSLQTHNYKSHINLYPSTNSLVCKRFIIQLASVIVIQQRKVPFCSAPFTRPDCNTRKSVSCCLP